MGPCRTSQACAIVAALGAGWTIALAASPPSGGAPVIPQGVQVTCEIKMSAELREACLSDARDAFRKVNPGEKPTEPADMGAARHQCDALAEADRGRCMAYYRTRFQLTRNPSAVRRVELGATPASDSPAAPAPGASAAPSAASVLRQMFNQELADDQRQARLQELERQQAELHRQQLAAEQEAAAAAQRAREQQEQAEEDEREAERARERQNDSESVMTGMLVGAIAGKMTGNAEVAAQVAAAAGGNADAARLGANMAIQQQQQAQAQAAQLQQRRQALSAQIAAQQAQDQAERAQQLAALQQQQQQQQQQQRQQQMQQLAQERSEQQMAFATRCLSVQSNYIQPGNAQLSIPDTQHFVVANSCTQDVWAFITDRKGNGQGGTVTPGNSREFVFFDKGYGWMNHYKGCIVKYDVDHQCAGDAQGLGAY